MPSRRGGPSGWRASAIPRRTRNAANGASVAPVSISTALTAAIRSRDPATDPPRMSRVAAEVLRQRLDDEVRPELDRAAQDRRGERVVDDEQGAVPVGELGQGGDVDHDDRRVGDRLDVEDAGRAERPVPASTAGEVGRVDELDATPEPAEALGRAASGSSRRSPACRRCGRRPDGPTCRAAWIAAMPVEKTYAGLGALELGDRVGEGGRRSGCRCARRRSRARAGRDRAELVRVVGGERHGLVDRHRVRALVDRRGPASPPRMARVEKPRGAAGRSASVMAGCYTEQPSEPVAGSARGSRPLGPWIRAEWPRPASRSRSAGPGPPRRAGSRRSGSCPGASTRTSRGRR